jgi:hypothetical protein
MQTILALWRSAFSGAESRAATLERLSRAAIQTR